MITIRLLRGPLCGHSTENVAVGTGNFKIEDAIRQWTNEACECTLAPRLPRR